MDEVSALGRRAAIMLQRYNGGLLGQIYEIFVIPYPYVEKRYFLRNQIISSLFVGVRLGSPVSKSGAPSISLNRIRLKKIY